MSLRTKQKKLRQSKNRPVKSSKLSEVIVFSGSNAETPPRVSNGPARSSTINTQSLQREKIALAPIFLQRSRGLKTKAPDCKNLQISTHLPQINGFQRGGNHQASSPSADLHHADTNRSTLSTAVPPSVFHSSLERWNPRFTVQTVLKSLCKKTNNGVEDGETANEGQPSSSSWPRLPGHTHSTEKRKRGLEISDNASKRPRPVPSGDDCVLHAEKDTRQGRLSLTHRLRQRSRITGPQENFSPIPSTEQNISHGLPADSGCDDVLWTEKYGPRKSSEVIGNSASVDKLHRWLKRWKQRAAREEDRKEGANLREDRYKEVWDCGDFEGESLMEEHGVDEELRTAVLLTGPPGVGKTASVYACAQELGFKVFEVNCSSLRSGRAVLSQLKEATQSHLVETSGNDTRTPAYLSSRDLCPGKSEVLPGKSKPSGSVQTTSKRRAGRRGVRSARRGVTQSGAALLASFFRTEAKSDRLKSASPPPRRTQDGQTPLPCQAENKAAVTSLILFEEVDVVFQDDVGFLAAVQAFMSTTKRPVVLTTNDPLFGDSFGGSLEEIAFKSPPVPAACSFLQLVCLAEGVRANPDDLRHLFGLCRGDLRRCLLQLQLWVRGGRGRTSRGTDQHGGVSGCAAAMLGLLPVSRTYLHTFLKRPDLEVCEPLQVLAESWRRGAPLLHCNLDLLLPEDTAATSPPAQSQDGETANALDALSDFLDIMSHLDAALPAAPPLVSGPCRTEDFTGMGAELKDGLTDEMREEEDGSTSLGRVEDVRAALEGLGCRSCWRGLSKARTDKRGGGRDVRTEGRRLCFNLRPLCEPSLAQKRRELSRAMLSSPPLGLLGDRRAVCVDYAPVLRAICRSDAAQAPQDETDRCPNYISRLGLGFSKSTIQHLTQGFT